MPDECVICESETGELICSFCRELLVCPSDKKLLFSIKTEEISMECAACFSYENHAAKKLIFSLKRNDRRELVGFAAEKLSEAVRLLDIDGKVIFVNIPRSRKGLMEYGFDQAALLAKSTSLLYSNAVYANILGRRGFSEQQKKLSRNERKENQKGKIFVKKLFNRIKPDYDGCFVVVDDVCTTGASFAECAGKLGSMYPKAKIYGAFIAAT